MNHSALQRHAVAVLCVVALLLGAVVFGMDVAVLVGLFATTITMIMLVAEPIRRRGAERLRQQRKAELRAMRRGGP